jgi:hypothetical protein
MGREDEILMIAYGLRVRDGNDQGRFLERWLKAEAIWEYNHKSIPVLEQSAEPPVKADRVTEKI